MTISILLSMQAGETERCNDDGKAVTQEECMEGECVCVCVGRERAVLMQPYLPLESRARVQCEHCSRSG